MRTPADGEDGIWRIEDRRWQIDPQSSTFDPLSSIFDLLFLLSNTAEQLLKVLGLRSKLAHLPLVHHPEGTQAGPNVLGAVAGDAEAAAVRCGVVLHLRDPIQVAYRCQVFDRFAGLDHEVLAR